MLLAPIITTVHVGSLPHCLFSDILTGEAPGLQSTIRWLLRAVSRARSSSVVALASRGTSPVQPELVKAKREGTSCVLGARETGKAVVLYAVVASSSAGCCAAKAIASFAQQSCNPKEPELYILANQHASIERSDASAAGQSSRGRGISEHTRIPVNLIIIFALHLFQS